LNHRRIAIAGGGIGGLAAALALVRAGFEVSVHERTPLAGEAGAGLTITPSGSRVLRALGLGDWIRRCGDRPECGVVGDGRSGDVLAWNIRRDEVEARHGAEYFQVHRADLHAALAGELARLAPGALRANDGFESVEQDEGGVRVRFAASGTIEADALVGADGAGSTVRAALFGADRPEFTGCVAYRGLVPRELLPDVPMEQQSAMFVGPGRLFVRYLVRQGQLVSYVCITRSLGWIHEGWALGAGRAELLAELGGWHPPLRALVERTPEGALFKWGLFERAPLHAWTRGATTLLGDAAHPMLPFLGQSTVMALEDAAVLARAFEAAGSAREALMRYERARRERAERVVVLSRETGMRLLTHVVEPGRAGTPLTSASLGLMDYDATTAAV
jgi:salicylate hydroxylase